MHRLHDALYRKPSFEDLHRLHEPVPLFFVCALMGLAASNIVAAEYNGFRIDESRVHLTNEVRESLFRQIDIMESASLPPAVLDAMKQTPIVADPDLHDNPGIFTVRHGVASVDVQPVEFPMNKPILLHEFLHAYHFRAIHLDRPGIQEEFQLVKHSACFPHASSHRISSKMPRKSSQ